MSTTQKHTSFRVGDHVKFDYGQRQLNGVIVEARGGIGARGRHLFKVEVPMDPFDPMTLELAEDEIQAMPSESPAVIRDNAKVIEYLIYGGLISILRSNISGGKNQPRVWLCLDNLGNITHTFVPERGVTGGQMVPYWAIHDSKIFSAKRDVVLEYLLSFGLNHQEAKKVIAEVGTSP